MAIATKMINKSKIVVSSGCSVMQAVETACNGFNKTILCKLLENLKFKSKGEIEVNHVKDKIYYVKTKNKEGMVEIPEIITKLGLIIMLDYLAKNPKLCNGCSLFEKKGGCPKQLFV